MNSPTSLVANTAEEKRTPAEERAVPGAHYSAGRRWSSISKAWIFAESWNDAEELARLRETESELQVRFDVLTEALEECEDYFDNRADVKDGSYGEPVANTEMRLLEVVRKALKVQK